MSTLELKLAIYDKLKSVDDDGLLEKIMRLLKTVDEDKIYHLSEYELNMLKEGEEDIKAGRLYTNEEVMAEEKKWLNE
jgi:predicted transcriptional regulator